MMNSTDQAPARTTEREGALKGSLVSLAAPRLAGRQVVRVAARNVLLRVGVDANDNVFIEVDAARGPANAEFCRIGPLTERSPNTRRALIALMEAIQADNEQSPAYAGLHAQIRDSEPLPSSQAMSTAETDEAQIQEVAGDAVRFYGEPMAVALAAARGAWRRAHMLRDAEARARR